MKKNIKIFLSLLIAYIFVISYSVFSKTNMAEYMYDGVSKTGWNPASILLFAFTSILLYRFFDNNVLNNKGRLLLASCFGLMISISLVWGTMMMYDTYSIFDTSIHTVKALLLPLGFSLLFIPIISEIIGFFDYMGEHSISFSNAHSRLSAYFDKHPVFIFFLIWAIIFITYLPLFFYWWPGNFIYDAAYEIDDFLVDGRMSSHFPTLHVILLGLSYSFGQKINNISLGMQIYTLFQMVTLSGAFAFFIASIRLRKLPNWLYYTTIALIILNPVNRYFAVTAANGTLCGSFLIISTTFLLNYMSKDNSKKINIVLFVIFMILATLFRKNLIFAVLIGGFITVFLQKGLKKKGIMLLAILLICVVSKLCNSGMLKVTNAHEAATYRESLSLPIMCLTRAAINHKDEMKPEYYSAICVYIPEEVQAGYLTFLADPIKEYVSESFLRYDFKNFIKLWIKVGLDYPGDYIESIVGLTIGYWYTGASPYWLYGNTQFGNTYSSFGLDTIENTHILPDSFGIIEWLFGPSNGRLDVPLFGWFWRGTIYTWTFFIGAGYMIYKKNKRGLSLIMIPLFYLLSCFLGPVSWLRYIYPNVTLFPFLIYLLFTASHSESDQRVS